MDLVGLNNVCFVICVVCIVVGVVMAVAMIWISGNSEVLWKGFATVAVLFTGSALTLIVNKTLGGRLAEKS